VDLIRPVSKKILNAAHNNGSGDHSKRHMLPRNSALLRTVFGKFSDEKALKRATETQARLAMLEIKR